MNGMSQQRPQAARWRGGPWGSSGARVAVAACLLVLIGAGLRATVPAPRLDGPFRQDGLGIGAVLEAVLVCVAIALWVRHRQAPRDAVVAARLRRLLAYVVAAGLIAIPALYLASRAGKATLRPVKPVPAPSATGHGHVQGAGHLPVAVAIVLVIVIGLLAAGLIYLIARFLWRHRGPWSGLRGRARDFPVPASGDDDEPGLRNAVESGYSALRRLDDARAAIIACYVAMEQSLADAGTARAAADTPDELLARAAAHGLVRGGAAARLTALFYEARFSSHPMVRSQRDDAQHALAELAASLGSGPEAETAAGPGEPSGAGAAGGAGGANGAGG
jgi:hypothetical protein